MSRICISLSEPEPLLSLGREETYITYTTVPFWSAEKLSFIESTDLTFNSSSSYISLSETKSMMLGPCIASISAFMTAPFISPLLMYQESQRQRWTFTDQVILSVWWLRTPAAMALGVCPHAMQRSSRFMTTPIGSSTHLIPRTSCLLLVLCFS